MSFCTFSSELVIEDNTNVSNLFIHEFMPQAPDNFTKVYLYGLFMCSNSFEKDNSVEKFSKRLNLTSDEILTAFYYWKQQGLVQIIDTDPLTVKYLPLNNLMTNIKLHKKGKYDAFNQALSQIIKGRDITMNEYNSYYDLMERDKLEQEALLMIIKYCINYKNKTNMPYKYLIAVANNWVGEGILTALQVEDRLKEYETIDTNLGTLLKTLGIKRTISLEERDLYNQWKKIYGFDEETIVQTAKLLKKNKTKLNFEALEKHFEKYYKMQLLELGEIKAYEDNLENLKDIAVSVLKKIGLYYDNLEPVIENYIQNWVNLGYDKQTLVKIAEIAFLKNQKTLSALDFTIQKLYKLGVVSEESLYEHINELSQQDKIIKKLLEELGLSRNVNAYDRKFYKTWTVDWNTNGELLEYATNLSKDKIQPTIYLNKILSNFFENKVKTVEEAKKLAPIASQNNLKTKQKEFKGRSYTKEDMTAFFDCIDEIEV